MGKVLIIILIFPTISLAYIDPSPGNYLFQIIIGVVGSGLLIFKINLKRIKEFFKKYFLK
jgi:hypothetical protein